MLCAPGGGPGPRPGATAKGAPRETVLRAVRGWGGGAASRPRAEGRAEGLDAGSLAEPSVQTLPACPPPLPLSKGQRHLPGPPFRQGSRAAVAQKRHHSDLGPSGAGGGLGPTVRCGWRLCPGRLRPPQARMCCCPASAGLCSWPARWTAAPLLCARSASSQRSRPSQSLVVPAPSHHRGARRAWRRTVAGPRPPR